MSMGRPPGTRQVWPFCSVVPGKSSRRVGDQDRCSRFVDRLWRFAFNRQFAKAANKLPDNVVRYYVDALAANPGALRGRFAAYRALDTTIAQNGGARNRG